MGAMWMCRACGHRWLERGWTDGPCPKCRVDRIFPAAIIELPASR